MFAPKRTDHRALVAVVLCGILSAVCFLAGAKTAYHLPFQLVGIAALVLAIELSARYLFTDLLYALSSPGSGRNDLSVVRVRGKKRQILACFTLNEAVGIVPSSVPKKEKEEKFGAVHTAAEFTVDLFASDTYDLFLYFQGKTMRVRLQCDAAFAKEIENRIPIR